MDKPTWQFDGSESEPATVYRTITTGGRTTRWGYGRAAKVDVRSFYTDRVTSELVIVYAVRGTGRFVDGRGEGFAVESGDVLIHWPGTACSLTVETDGRWLERWVIADRGFADAMERIGVISPDRTVLRIGVHGKIVEGFDRLGRDLRDMHDQDVDRYCVQLHDLLVEMNGLTRGCLSDDGDVAMVRTACRLLAEQFDAVVHLPEIAASLGFGYERFRKVFKRRVGVAPGEYRVRRRIDRARELIIQLGLNNREIADRLGYADPFSFSKQFKLVVGESPESFRRRMT